MNYALHYLCYNYDCINALNKLISSLLDKNGIFICSYFDGEKIYKDIKQSINNKLPLKTFKNIETEPFEKCLINIGKHLLDMKNSFDKEFLEEVEEEYRLQIEEGLKHFKPEHIDSHVHMHAIPNLFKIVCKLAKEYDIPYIRTQFEKPYLIPNMKMFSKTNLIPK